MDLTKVKNDIIKKLNKYTGSMTKLAKEAGVSRPYLYDLKKGNIKRPRIDDLAKINKWFESN